MRRYLEIYGIMLRNSLIRELSFKANFLLWMVVEVLWFLGQILFFSIIFGQVDQIGDWTKWEVVLLVGTHQIIAQLFQAFFFVNVANIPELVRTGKLDSLLVLPLDSQFVVSTKQFGLDSIVNALVGVFVVVLSLVRLGVTPGPVAIVLYLRRARFGVAIHYSIMLTLAAVSFWIVRAQGLVYGYFNFLNIARYPGCDFPAGFPLGLRLDHSGDHRGEHSGPAVDQVVRPARLADVSPHRRRDDRRAFEPAILALGAAALLQRELVDRRGRRARFFQG